uniref:Uncharacterized protein n=1 Tax=Oryza sativa subsp. japonica TaxID=39947 RepID=Q9FWM1_ORYSJ|nr:hypothetical protein [Oryza sativa Japonica Group]
MGHTNLHSAGSRCNVEARLFADDVTGVRPVTNRRDESAIFDLAEHEFEVEGYPVVDYESDRQTAMQPRLAVAKRLRPLVDEEAVAHVFVDKETIGKPDGTVVATVADAAMFDSKARLEALLDFHFNVREVKMGTYRPFVL